MKNQIVFIHGGSAYSNYDSFIEDLRTKTILDPQGVEKTKRWKESIYEEFGSICDVFYPKMPNSENAHYHEWKIWFERYFEYLTGRVILIGHSQGGVFLAKFLSENAVPFPVAALFLVAAPFGATGLGDEDGGDFTLDPEKLSAIEKLSSNIAIFHSADDAVVPFSHAESYAKVLPNASLHKFTDRGHFLDPEFPEILNYLRDLL